MGVDSGDAVGEVVSDAVLYEDEEKKDDNRDVMDGEVSIVD